MSRLIRTTKTDRFMRTYYPACGAPIVAEALGLSKQQVRQYASRLGIKTRNRGGKPFEAGHDSRRGHGRKAKQGNTHEQPVEFDDIPF